MLDRLLLYAERLGLRGRAAAEFAEALYAEAGPDADESDYEAAGRRLDPDLYRPRNCAFCGRPTGSRASLCEAHSRPRR